MTSKKPNVCSTLRLEDTTAESGTIRFKLMPTLHHIAVVKIASHLWASKDIGEEASKIFETAHSARTAVYLASFMSLSLVIEEEVALLPLPMEIISHVRLVIGRLAMEMFKWIDCQYKLDCSFDPWNHLHSIQWTTRGRIDGGKTAQLIMSKEGISEDYKSKATKYYCFNLTGKALLEQMIANCSDIKFCNMDNLADSRLVLDSLIRYRLPNMPDEESYFLISEEKMKEAIKGPPLFELSRFCDGRALRQLWDALTEETKSKVLSTYYWGNGVDSMCFFLSQMDRETQRNFFKNRISSLGVLVILFSDWLLQDFFLPTFLAISPANLNRILIHLIHKMAHLMMSSYFCSNAKCTEIFTKMLNIIIASPDFDEQVWDHREFKEVLALFFNAKTMSIFDLLYSVVPADKKTEHLDTYLNLHLQFEEFPLIRYIVKQTFDSPEEVEEYFFNKILSFHNFSFFHIRMIRSLIRMFIFDKAKIESLKRKILQDVSAGEIENLLSCEDYNSVERMFLYCFSGDKKLITEFKQTQIFNRISPITLTSMAIKEGMKLEKLFCFCFGEEEGVSIGKKYLLQDKQLLRNIVMPLDSRWAKLFLNWCFSVDEAAKKNFKEEFDFEF